ncbi:MAG: FliM/FliN family flagellar motor switch protein [Polyangiaceae bacterium]
MSTALRQMPMRPRAGKPERGSLRPVDLTGRERHLRAAMQAMGSIASRFARAARRTLPFLVRRRARLATQPVALAAAHTELPGGEGPRFEVRLEAEDSGAWGSLVLNADALSVLLEASLGGGENTGSTPLGAELSLAQAALVARIARSLAADFALAVKNEAGLVLAVVSSRSVRSGDTGEAGAVDGLFVDCSFEGVSESALLTISISAEALETAAREHAEEDQPVAADPRMAEAIADVAVEVVAELGTITLGLRQVLGLSVGQVLRLPTAIDDPVVVRVAGLRKFEATPVISRGQLSIQVKGRHEA